MPPHQWLPPPSLLLTTHRSSRAGTKWGKVSLFNQHCPTTRILCYYHYYNLLKLKEESLSFIAFSAGLSLCLKNFCFPSFRMICVPRLHSLHYFPWWIYAHHVPHFLSCVLNQFFSLHNQELSRKTLACIWLDLMMINPPESGLWGLESATSGFQSRFSHLLTK